MKAWAKIFREAARKIAEKEERYSCFAIYYSVLKKYRGDADFKDMIRDRYFTMLSSFSAQDVHYRGWISSAHFENDILEIRPGRTVHAPCSKEQYTNHRVIALLLMAELEEDNNCESFHPV